jgi:purine nucleoside phosphorylase
MTKAVLGIVGGSGIYDLPGLTNAQSRIIESPWGKPSGALLTGEIAGLPIVFLSRHGKGHRLSPSDINYRANIDILKRAGVTDLVSLSACGSFKAELPPGTFVLIDQFVDRTHGRASSSRTTITGRDSVWPFSSMNSTPADSSATEPRQATLIVLRQASASNTASLPWMRPSRVAPIQRRTGSEGAQEYDCESGNRRRASGSSAWSCSEEET